MFGDAGVLLRGGQGYRNFTQTPDDEVIALLDRARDSFAEAVAIDAADPPLRDEEVRVLAGPVTVADTCVGTDSHTTMVNGLGVLGWGVGGIEAEAAMLASRCRC